MRLRTVAASAALVLCATVGAAACSSSPDVTDADRPAAPATAPAPGGGPEGKIETGKRQAGGPEVNGQSVAGPEKCATSAADIPAECALDLSFVELSEGERAAEPPVLP
ncbi:hypothetical protein ACFWM7_16885 [Streptomyces sp. NPDC058375]|uniref:hypothetical protein n=1 Tax=Streptomyces sp. NPDC058375 TaxID=3346467 RepID=UPI0036641377